MRVLALRDARGAATHPVDLVLKEVIVQVPIETLLEWRVSRMPLDAVSEFELRTRPERNRVA